VLIPQANCCFAICEPKLDSCGILFYFGSNSIIACQFMLMLSKLKWLTKGCPSPWLQVDNVEDFWNENSEEGKEILVKIIKLSID
jgi:hypothetical protein